MSKPSVLSLYRDMRKVTRGGLEAIRKQQQKGLNAMMAFARNRSRFYAKHFSALPEFDAGTDIDIRQIPPVHKPELMADFDGWVTDPAVTRAAIDAFIADKSLVGHLFLGRYMVYTTSGSTGIPAIFLHDDEAWAVSNALILARAFMPYLNPALIWRLIKGRARAAAIFVTEGHFGGYAMVRRRQLERPIREKMQRVFSAMQPLPDLVNALNAFKPVMLGGYATVLDLLAREKLAGRLKIQPALMSAAGETLTPQMRQRIVSAFRCELIDSYSASEAVGMTFQCKHGRMHFNADWFILEPIDSRQQPVPPGEFSHSVLLTNLANRVQPVIRYELGDRVLVEPEPCTCGNPLPVIRVEGRTDDVLIFRAADGHDIPVLPLALTTAIEEAQGLYRFQAIQTSPTGLKLRFEAAPGVDTERLWAELERIANRFLDDQGLSNINLERSLEPVKLHSGSGKLRQVWAEKDARTKGTPISTRP